MGIMFTKATDSEAGVKDFTGKPPSSKPKVPTPVLDSGHREMPVHVTQQLSRTVDAERPPSNRQGATQPPGKGAVTQSGNDDKNQRFGSGIGGDRDGNGTGTAILSKTAAAGDPRNWRWACVGEPLPALWYYP